jgi:hypothetical protein
VVEGTLVKKALTWGSIRYHIMGILMTMLMVRIILSKVSKALPRNIGYARGNTMNIRIL